MGYRLNEPSQRRDLEPTDRAYSAKVVSARTGLSEADAEKRVSEVVSKIETDLGAAC
jgi:hypothetical protein